MIEVMYVNGHQLVMFIDATFHFDYFECLESHCDNVNLFYKGRFIGAVSFAKGRKFMEIMGARV
jgi:hypothetical protein